MGGARRAAIAAELVAQGWQPSTPAALVAEASRTDQHTWRGTLEDLAADRVPADHDRTDGPVTIVVGAVAALTLSGSVSVPAETKTEEAGRRGPATRGKPCQQLSTSRKARTAAPGCRLRAWRISTSSWRRSRSTSAAS